MRLVRQSPWLYLMHKAETKDRFVLTEALSARFERPSLNVTVEAGFETDLSSVLRPLRSLASKTDAIHASVIHDWLYAKRLVERAMADAVFLAAMEMNGISWRRRRLMHRAVRWFGRRVYDINDPPEDELDEAARAARDAGV